VFLNQEGHEDQIGKTPLMGRGRGLRRGRARKTGARRGRRESEAHVRARAGVHLFCEWYRLQHKAGESSVLGQAESNEWHPTGWWATPFKYARRLLDSVTSSRKRLASCPLLWFSLTISYINLNNFIFIYLKNPSLNAQGRSSLFPHLLCPFPF
jgi:hypothetical protein